MRVGKPREGRAARSRPIQVVFASGEGKHAALRRGKDIRAKVNLFPHWRGANLFYRQDGQVKEDLDPRPPTASPPPGQAPSAFAPVAPARPSYALVAMP